MSDPQLPPSNVPPPPPPPPPPSMAPPPPPPPASFGVPPAYGEYAAPYGAPPRYAGWWRRVAAWVIDGLISAIFLVPGYVALLAGPTEIGSCEDWTGGDGLCEVPTDATLGLAVLLFLAGFVVYFVIHVRMLGKGATWGRKAAGYRVLDERTMQPIGTGRAVGRYFAVLLSTLPCYLGLLWPLWDAEKRTFHDMVVRTRAIKN